MTLPADARDLVEALQRVLHISVENGQVILHFRDGRLELVETRRFERLRRVTAKQVDKVRVISVQ